MSNTRARVSLEERRRTLRRLQNRRAELLRTWSRLSGELNAARKAYGTRNFDADDDVFSQSVDVEAAASLQQWCDAATGSLSLLAVSFAEQRTTARRQSIREDLPHLDVTGEEIARLEATRELLASPMPDDSDQERDGVADRDEAERLIDRFGGLEVLDDEIEEIAALTNSLRDCWNDQSERGELLTALRRHVTKAQTQVRTRARARRAAFDAFDEHHAALAECENTYAKQLLRQLELSCAAPEAAPLSVDFATRVEEALKEEVVLERREVAAIVQEVFAAEDYIGDDGFVDVLAAGGDLLLSDADHRGHGLRLRLDKNGHLDIAQVRSEATVPDRAAEHAWCNERRKRVFQFATEQGLRLDEFTSFEPGRVDPIRVPVGCLHDIWVADVGEEETKPAQQRLEKSL